MLWRSARDLRKAVAQGPTEVLIRRKNFSVRVELDDGKRPVKCLQHRSSAGP